jgi:hypothetical protein
MTFFVSLLKVRQSDDTFSSSISVLADHSSESPTGDREAANYASQQQQQQQQQSSSTSASEMVKTESASAAAQAAAAADMALSSTAAAASQQSGGGERSPNAEYMRGYGSAVAVAPNAVTGASVTSAASPSEYQASYGYYAGNPTASGGQYYGAQTGGGGGGGAGFNSPAMASLLYPHLYSAASMNPAALQLHGNGLSDASGLTGSASDEYGLSADRAGEAAALAAAAAADVAAASGHYAHHLLEGGGDDSHTGPIRGGGGVYSARAEHGGHVWRPY